MDIPPRFKGTPQVRTFRQDHYYADGGDGDDTADSKEDAMGEENTSSFLDNFDNQTVLVSYLLLKIPPCTSGKGV